MDELRQIIVNDHIHDLQRDAQDLRSEREIRLLVTDSEPNTAPGPADRSGARVRLGHWLIGVGLAVAGSAGDAHGGTAGRAA